MIEGYEVCVRRSFFKQWARTNDAVLIETTTTGQR